MKKTACLFDEYWVGLLEQKAYKGIRKTLLIKGYLCIVIAVCCVVCFEILAKVLMGTIMKVVIFPIDFPTLILGVIMTFLACLEFGGRAVDIFTLRAEL